tara:strand:+ start:5861 stop:7207 length:1347 start_codon:yes stop_codon:yes gene_type:complete
MLIENEKDLVKVQNSLNSGDSLWIPMYSDPFAHFMNNFISFIYIYSITDSKQYILPFRHKDCFNLNIEHLNGLTSQGDIYVLAKKRFSQFSSIKCYDADMVGWWQNHKMLPLDETNTTAHDAWNRWWHNETNTHDWLPITKHIERCEEMKNKFIEYYKTFDKTKDFEEYEQLVTDNFSTIERTGLQVNYNKFIEHFKANGILKNKAYTEYNIYTTTGRPSNKFGGVNYAALPKETGCRESFISRFEHGMLIEMDFDAYHPRLIADIIGYDLPERSVHTYFAKQYFGKDKISDQEYEDSKKITFRLLYGGIDKDFEKVPFFGKTKTYINKLWNIFKSKGYVLTPLMKRPLYKNCLHDMNPNKLFNYLLQASETEYNLHMLNNVNDLLSEYNTNIILYTYDSLLFDYDMKDGKELLLKLRDIMSQAGRFPVKTKAGVNYHVMKDMTSRIS